MWETFFVSDLIENIEAFSKQPPSTIIYVYKVWQTKFDEMRSIVHIFIPDNENIVNQLKELAKGQPILPSSIPAKSLSTIITSPPSTQPTNQPTIRNSF